MHETSAIRQILNCLADADRIEPGKEVFLMSLTSAMGAGVASLLAHATRLASISDNIANSSTLGYRRVITEFDSIVLGGTGGGGYSAGGVRATNGRRVDQAGALVSTGNALDVAIDGGGMLPTTGIADVAGGSSNLPLLMTRTGSFEPDEDGYLRTASGLVLMGWAFNADGTLPTPSRDTSSSLTPVRLPLSQATSTPTTRVELGVTLPATETALGADGVASRSTIEYYANLGTTEFLDITYTPLVSETNEMSLTWQVDIKDLAKGPDDNLIGSYTIVFDGTAEYAGSISSVTTISGEDYNPETGNIPLNVAGGALDLVIGQPQAKNKLLQQIGASYAQENIETNGAPVGRYTSAEIDENGILRVAYDNDEIQSYYKIPIVTVPNVNGLTAGNAQTYSVSKESGSFFLWDAADGPAGRINGYAREASTTDIAEELTNMIQTQRAYASNAKIIQTVDEMMQETTNIKR